MPNSRCYCYHNTAITGNYGGCLRVSMPLWRELTTSLDTKVSTDEVTAKDESKDGRNWG